MTRCDFCMKLMTFDERKTHICGKLTKTCMNCFRLWDEGFLSDEACNITCQKEIYEGRLERSK